jgi:hypothetical protein
MENVEIKQHPVYTAYGADCNGIAYNFKKSAAIKITNDKYGYSYIHISIKGFHKSLRLSRFVYECFNGSIPVGLDIDHINNIRNDNRIINLLAINHPDNIKKKYTGGYVNNHVKIGCGKHIEALNLQNNVLTYYNSLYGAGVALNIVPASVRRVCRCQQHSAISKDSGIRYSFQFVEH